MRRVSDRSAMALHAAFELVSSVATHSNVLEGCENRKKIDPDGIHGICGMID